jgi:hypothetical protein
MIDHLKGRGAGTPGEPMPDDDMEQALIAANAATVLRHRRLGIPLLIHRGGKMVEVSPFDVPVPTIGQSGRPAGPGKRA